MTPEIDSATLPGGSLATGRVARKARRTGPAGPGPSRHSWRGLDTRRARGVCESCGEPARAHILEGYSGGMPNVRRFCLNCVDEHAEPLPEPPKARSGLPAGLLLGLVSVVFGVLGVFGDSLLPEVHAGFGWYQRLGVGLGALLVLTGTLLRVDLIALSGAFLFAGSICADWFGLVHSPGIGWKQQAFVGISAACVLVVFLRRMAGTHIDGRSRRIIVGG